MNKKNQSILGSSFNVIKVTPQKKNASKEPEASLHNPSIFPSQLKLRDSRPDSSRHQSRQQSIERESRYTTRTVPYYNANIDASVNHFNMNSRKVSISSNHQSNQESHKNNVSCQ